MSEPLKLGLFEAFGIELEYMIVRRDTLDVLPVTDKVLREIAGEYVNEVKVEDLEWSNELTLHVIELKTGRPAPTLAGLADKFHRHVQRISALLQPLGGRLMPTSMHPWMDPYKEMALWPHDNSPIYDAYNRIFDCRGHGWANLQSMHINLPFNGPEEFGRLHAAIRLVLPLLPALAAASPVAEGELNPNKDERLEVYRHNQDKVPAIAGDIIPEPVFSPEDYEAHILQPLYRAIAPLDPEGILQEEWLNSRGAIARFDRDAIEIRLLDIQECPRADLAIAAAVVRLIQALVQEKWLPYAAQQKFDTMMLKDLLMAGIADAESAVVSDTAYLRAFGLEADGLSFGQLWQHVAEQLFRPGTEDDAFLEPLGIILRHGSLSTRIRRALGGEPAQEDLVRVYTQLCECLDGNHMFVPHV